MPEEMQQADPTTIVFPRVDWLAQRVTFRLWGKADKILMENGNGSDGGGNPPRRTTLSLDKGLAKIKQLSRQRHIPITDEQMYYFLHHETEAQTRRRQEYLATGSWPEGTERACERRSRGAA